MKSLPKNPVIGIVGGRGVLGQIFQRAFEDAGFTVLISGRHPDGKKVLSNRVLARKADVVIVSVFLKDTAKVLREIAPLLNSRQLFCDFTSLKVEPVKLMLKSRAEVVGLHPMFGETNSLVGQNIFACPARAKKWWPWLQKTLTNFGLNIHVVSPKKHDELAAIHQNVPHLLTIAFTEFLRQRQCDPEKLFAVSSPSTQLALLTAGRLLSQNAEMYADIQLLNPAARKAAADMAEIFTKLATTVAQKNRAKILTQLHDEAAHFGEWRNFALSETNQIFGNLTKQEAPKPSLNEKKKGRKRKLKKVDFAVFGRNTQTELAMFRFAVHLKLIGKKDQEIKITFHDPNFSSSKLTITKVFEAVSNGEAKWGFVPLENNSIGPVREAMRQLFEANGKIRIWHEYTHKIHHALFGRKDTNGKIKRIFAHPQAHAQCDKFLKKNYAKADLISAANAGEALKLASQDLSALAIGPSGIIPREFKGVLISVRDKIEDDKNNLTRFIAVAKNIPKKHSPKNPRKTALAFFFRQNKAGQLAAALAIFAENKINLSRIESIPTEKQHGEFLFFTECEIVSTHARFQQCVTELKKIASVVNLGSY